MNIVKNTLLLGVAALALCATAGVNAQQPSDKASDKTMQAKASADHTAMRDKMRQHMHSRMEKHRAQLHDKLKLSPTQEPAWKSFIEAVMPSMADMHHGAKPGQDSKTEAALTTPAQMEKMLAQAKARVERMQTKLEALKTFYALLSPEQQKTFDESHHAMRKQMQHARQKMHGQQRMRHTGE